MVRSRKIILTPDASHFSRIIYIAPVTVQLFTPIALAELPSASSTSTAEEYRPCGALILRSLHIAADGQQHLARYRDPFRPRGFGIRSGADPAEDRVRHGDAGVRSS